MTAVSAVLHLSAELIQLSFVVVTSLLTWYMVPAFGAGEREKRTAARQQQQCTTALLWRELLNKLELTLGFELLLMCLLQAASGERGEEGKGPRHWELGKLSRIANHARDPHAAQPRSAPTRQHSQQSSEADIGAPRQIQRQTERDKDELQKQETCPRCCEEHGPCHGRSQHSGERLISLLLL